MSRTAVGGQARRSTHRPRHRAGAVLSTTAETGPRQLAARQLGWPSPGPLRNAEITEDGEHVGRRMTPGELLRELDVLGHGQVMQQVRALEQDTDAPGPDGRARRLRSA